MKTRWIATLLGAAFLWQSGLAQAQCTAESGPYRTALLELYTSEGCNSCPPADRWLSQLADAGHTARALVPLAWHVDYWDRLGWKDRFAQPQFSARQRSLAATHRSALVYTPQVVLNGRDYRPWHDSSRFTRDLATINRAPAQASIQLDARLSATGTLRYSVEARLPARNEARLYIALFENNLESVIKAGENAGATLRHDYVVRSWIGPLPLEGRVSRTLELDPGWKSTDIGIAAFLQHPTTAEVLQALALTPCSSKELPPSTG